jgi:hypothetical protein
MNDTEIFKLTDIMSRTGIEKVHFEFQDAYCDIVYCIIERTQRGRLPVMRYSDNSDDALKNALELLERVKPLDAILKMPNLDEQPYYHGYYREMIDAENEVEFQNIGDKFAVTGINRKDSDGFYYSEKPYPIQKKKIHL